MDPSPPGISVGKPALIHPLSANNVYDPRLYPSRWWFASSVFPLIAGTLGPVASAFSICALVRPWRQHMPPGTTLDEAAFIHDPPWLIIVNAIQLAVALLSNAFLLLNMTRRVRFSIAQPITIVGWYVSSICLIALLATAAGPLALRPQRDYVWSQAFWYGMWAALLYFVVASLMCVTVYGALQRHYPLDFHLNNSQRTLMLQTIMFLMYILLGALVFSSLQGWNYLDSVYWAVVTLFTIGFGDMVLTTPTARAILIPYALVGIVSVGLVIGSIRTLALDRASRRVDARLVEKRRQTVVKTLSRQGRDSILRPIRARVRARALAHGGQDAATASSEIERREAEFNLMRHIQHAALVRRRWVDTLVSTIPWLILWLLGAFIFVRFEAPYQGWSYFEGVYFAFVSLTTLGYGDITPTSNGARSFFVFWALLALPTMTVLISNAGDTIVKFISDMTIQLGNITILPGEHGFGTDARFALHRLSCGLLFPQTFSAEDLESSSSVAGDSRGEENAGPNIRLPNPSSPAEYHYLLISAISTISKDVKETPRKKYSFAEWAYYLRLVGEDERSPQTHRMARLKSAAPSLARSQLQLDSHSHWDDHSDCHSDSHSHTHALRARIRKLKALLKRKPAYDNVEEESEEGDRWSWVGPLSPLMDGSESEWILERLTARLRSELEAVAAEEGERRSRRSGGGQGSVGDGESVVGEGNGRIRWAGEAPGCEK
ncbi:related to TOK1 - voltage-gated, outward-rectifying K+ channel [Cephalotrichum gorgonifer]|uniref:Related to TOK1 - voltage-gated, outward-rectifying K+ channel n=1 Tax=Cephalotrichum gorgonifer TaxID=2041049 RepID=A0AAE8SXM1_9PEZI|nr:related to TOK1 - voltage-gated, outward-rectifying K+ channel [Cephalotrichum gorgonifer]